MSLAPRAGPFPGLCSAVSSGPGVVWSRGVASAQDVPRFRRGDASADGTSDVGDAIFLSGNIVGAGKAPPCTDAATLQSVPPARLYFVVTANDLSGNESCFSTDFAAVVWVFD